MRPRCPECDTPSDLYIAVNDLKIALMEVLDPFIAGIENCLAAISRMLRRSK